VTAMQAAALRRCLDDGRNDPPRRFFRAAAAVVAVHWPPEPIRRKHPATPSGGWMSVKTGLAVQDHDAVSGTHKVRVLGLVEGGLLRFGRADAASSSPPVQAAFLVLKIGQQTSVRQSFSSAVSWRPTR
jgi:hypothetical protein